MLRAIVTDPATRTLRPTALSRAAVGAWVRQAVDGDAGDGFCAACHETTGGNPFLVRELLHEVVHKRLRATDAEAATVRELGPEAISTVVLQRLKRLPASAPAMARAVAILGEGAKPALAAELAGLDAPTAEEALDGALPRRRPHPRRARPARLRAPDRARRGLQRPRPCTRAPTATPAPPACVAARPRRSPRTSPAARRAATHGRSSAARRRRRALALGDPATAVAHLERALQEPPPDATRAAVLAELANAETRSGRPTAERALPRGDRGSAAIRTRAAQIAIGLARCLKFRGDSPRAIDVVRHALAELDADDPLAEELEIELVGAGVHLARRAAAAGRRDRPRSRRPTPSRTELDRLHLMVSAFETAIAAGPAERRRGATPGARSPAATSRPTSARAGTSYITAATVLMWSERYEEAERAYDQAVAEARRRGSSVGFAAASSLRSLLHYRLGRLSEAEADAVAALDLRDDVQGSQGYLACRAQRARVHRASSAASRDAGAARARRRLHRHPAHRGPALRPGDARPRLAARGARRPRGRAGGAAGLRRARARSGASGRRRSSSWRSAAAEVCLHARPARAGARAGRRGAATGAGDRRAAGDRRRAAGRRAGRVGRAADRAAAPRRSRRWSAPRARSSSPARASTSAARWSARAAARTPASICAPGRSWRSAAARPCSSSALTASCWPPARVRAARPRRAATSSRRASGG